MAPGLTTAGPASASRANALVPRLGKLRTELADRISTTGSAAIAYSVNAAPFMATAGIAPITAVLETATPGPVTQISVVRVSTAGAGQSLLETRPALIHSSGLVAQYTGVAVMAVIGAQRRIVTPVPARIDRRPLSRCAISNRIFYLMAGAYSHSINLEVSSIVLVQVLE